MRYLLDPNQADQLVILHRALSFRRHLPFHPRKSGVVAVKRDPIAATVEREGSEPGIGYERSARYGLDAQPPEDGEVAVTGDHDPTMRLLKQIASGKAYLPRER